MDGWMDGWMAGWMDGWMDERGGGRENEKIKNARMFYTCPN
jgi:hypothetical protein